jgi:beta-glucosidase
MKFPENFLWGAATSSYQVEGGNSHSDWWPWEIAVGKEKSGQACRHYELYEKDFDLAKSLNHNSHRLSIEWARVEPEQGKFNQQEIQHYIDVVIALRARGIEPVVTLHHFTNPIWLSKQGGWERKASVEHFARYTDVIVRALAKHVHYWITINEPTIYFSHSYMFGVWPPQAKSLPRAWCVHDHFILGHIRSYAIINKIYKELKLPKPMISISQHISANIACSPKSINRFAVGLRDKWYNFEILDKLVAAQTLDFIGVNYYSRQLVDVDNWWIGNLAMQTCQNNHDPVKKNSLGWDIYPKGIYQILMKLKNRYPLPIMITENGICTLDDTQRWEFIYEHLKNIHQAIGEGVPVIGYLYWSLLDNFEWDKGFGPRFGLIDVDYSSYQRTVRESAKKLAQVYQSGVLNPSL